MQDFVLHPIPSHCLAFHFTTLHFSLLQYTTCTEAVFKYRNIYMFMKYSIAPYTTKQKATPKIHIYLTSIITYYFNAMSPHFTKFYTLVTYISVQTGTICVFPQSSKPTHNFTHAKHNVGMIIPHLQ